jgi:outer membrane biosynthesis protein TonB
MSTAELAKLKDLFARLEDAELKLIKRLGGNDAVVSAAARIQAAESSLRAPILGGGAPAAPAPKPAPAPAPKPAAPAPAPKPAAPAPAPKPAPAPAPKPAAPAPAPPAPAPPPAPTPAGATHPYASLKSPGPYPAGVNAGERETYLSDAEFADLFKMDKAAFAALPKWKRDGKKKPLGLF